MPFQHMYNDVFPKKCQNNDDWNSYIVIIETGGSWLGIRSELEIHLLLPNELGINSFKTLLSLICDALFGIVYVSTLYLYISIHYADFV